MVICGQVLILQCIWLATPLPFAGATPPCSPNTVAPPEGMESFSNVRATIEYYVRLAEAQSSCVNTILSLEGIAGAVEVRLSHLNEALSFTSTLEQRAKRLACECSHHTHVPNCIVMCKGNVKGKVVLNLLLSCHLGWAGHPLPSRHGSSAVHHFLLGCYTIWYALQCETHHCAKPTCLLARAVHSCWAWIMQRSQ